MHYKGLYINGYCNQNACSVVDGNGLNEKFKSVRAAKIFITKYLGV